MLKYAIVIILCITAFITNDVLASPDRAQLKTNFSRNYAQIIEPEFTVASDQRGKWSGFIKGNGNILLQLLIIRDQNIEETRNLGRIKMHKNEKATRFNFLSPLPKGNNWSWKIIGKLL